MHQHALVLAFVTLCCTGCQPTTTPAPQSQPAPIGSDRDAHGCIGSAGYQWCAPKNSCVRAWELPDVAGSTLSPAQKWQKWCQADAS